MRKLLSNMAFGLAAVVLTGGLFYLIQYFYFGEGSRSFSVVAIILLIIVYSNFLAKLYEFTHSRGA